MLTREEINAASDKQILTWWRSIPPAHTADERKVEQWLRVRYLELIGKPEFDEMDKQVHWNMPTGKVT